jgi:hypothetical protein
MADVPLNGARSPAAGVNARPAPEEGTRFMVVPGLSDPRFLIPLGDGAEMAGALDLYNAQRPLARVAQACLRAGLRAGIAQAVLRDRVSLRTDALIEEHLRPLFGGARISASVSLGSPGPNQKPVLQVMDGRGEILGYAKVGWSRRSIDLIRNEEAALRMLEGRTFPDARVPQVVHAGRWRHLHVLVERALGGRAGAARHTMDERHIRFLVALHRVRPEQRRLPVPDEARIQELEHRGFHYYAHLLRRAREFCGGHGRLVPVPCGPLHGDFCPWNVRLFGGRLLVFDWEYARPAAPAGWDLFNFLIATAVSIRHHSAGEIYRTMAAPGATRALLVRYFDALDVAPALVAPLFVSYLADALSESCVLHGMAAGAQDVALRTTWAALLNLAFHQGAPGIYGRA